MQIFQTLNNNLRDRDYLILLEILKNYSIYFCVHVLELLNNVILTVYLKFSYCIREFKYRNFYIYKKKI